MTGASDCNPLDPAVHALAEQICDGLDNDCDGQAPSDEYDPDGDGRSMCEGDCDEVLTSRRRARSTRAA